MTVVFFFGHFLSFFKYVSLFGVFCIWSFFFVNSHIFVTVFLLWLFLNYFVVVLGLCWSCYWCFNLKREAVAQGHRARMFSIGSVSNSVVTVMEFLTSIPLQACVLCVEHSSILINLLLTRAQRGLSKKVQLVQVHQYCRKICIKIVSNFSESMLNISFIYSFSNPSMILITQISSDVEEGQTQNGMCWCSLRLSKRLKKPKSSLKGS